jgi:hypothetical protein
MPWAAAGRRLLGDFSGKKAGRIDVISRSGHRPGVESPSNFSRSPFAVWDC